MVKRALPARCGAGVASLRSRRENGTSLATISTDSGTEENSAGEGFITEGRF